MTHHDKDFLKYVCAYVLLGSSLLLIVMAIIGWTIGDEKVRLGGAAAGLVLGTLLLTSLTRRPPK
jgi:hypothetical protein